MRKLLVSGAGKDRPGIVAALTQVLHEAGCNIEDTSMTRLEDHFAMLVIALLPAGVALDVLEKRLGDAMARFDLVLSLRPIDTERETIPPRGRGYSISVSGPDRTGIIFHVTRYLAGLEVNILSLSSRRLTRASEAPVFLMMAEAEVPETLSDEALARGLSELGASEGLDIRAERLDEYTL
ncbi:MAG: ACT domain-containing protein [Thermoanaerobaculia bacterium]